MSFTSCNHNILSGAEKVYVILFYMSKEINHPNNRANAVRPTVFSDGSTFDYVNGYQSNGAIATRDKAPAKIVETGALMSSNAWSAILTAILLAALLALITYGGFNAYHKQANERAIINNINVSGQAEVVGGKIHDEGGQSTILIRDPSDQGVYKCDVDIARTPTATAFIFCAKPNPANFTLPVPYDPNDIFYTTPKQDN